MFASPSCGPIVALSFSHVVMKQFGTAQATRSSAAIRSAVVVPPPELPAHATRLAAPPPPAPPLLAPPPRAPPDPPVRGAGAGETGAAVDERVLRRAAGVGVPAGDDELVPLALA